MSNTLGELLIKVGADPVAWAELQDTLERTKAMLDNFGSSFSADGVTEGINQVTASVEQAETALQLAPTAVDEVKTSLEDFTNAGVSAGEQFSLFGGEIEASATQMDLFDTNAIAAAESMKQIGDGAAEAGAAAAESGAMFSELGKTLLEFAGIQITIEALRELASDSIAAFSTLQNATIALTALGGSASAAAEQIEGLEQLANKDALAFPTLLEAAQHMAAFGMSAEQVSQSLQLAADAAAATGNSFDNVSSQLDRMIELGSAGARQLAQLGVTQQQLAAVMGVAASQVAADFKAMDPTARLAVMSEALAKFSGDAQLMTNTVKGATNDMSNAWDKLMQTVGADIGPIAAAFEQLAAGSLRVLSDNWLLYVGTMEERWKDFMVLIGTGSTEGWAAFNAGAQQAKAGVDVVVAAFAAGKTAAQLFSTATASMFKTLADNQTAAGNMAVTLKTAQEQLAANQITMAQYLTVVDAYGKTLDAATVNGENFANSLVGVDTAAVKASNLLGESMQTLQQLTPGTADYARAIQNVGSAWDAANPGGVQFSNTLMGIGQETSQQAATLRSLSATFAQVSAGFQAGTVSANLFLNVAQKMSAAASAAHVAFASAAVDILNVKLATDQAAVSATAAASALATLWTGYQNGTVSLQALLKGLTDAESAAKATGQALQAAAIQALALNQNATLQVKTFQNDIAILGQYKDTVNLTAEQSIAAGTAFTNLATAGNALGIAVTKVAGSQNAFNIEATNSSPAVQKLVADMVTLFNQNGLTATAILKSTNATAGLVTEIGAAGVPVVSFAGAAKQAADATNRLALNFGAMGLAAQPIPNALLGMATALNQLNQAAANQVQSTENVFNAWVSLNSSAQTTIAGQLALQTAFQKAQTALGALGIQLTQFGATTNSTNPAVQALVKQLNDAIQQMQATGAPAQNAATAIDGIGNASQSAASKVKGLSDALSDAIDKQTELSGFGNSSFTTSAAPGSTVFSQGGIMGNASSYVVPLPTDPNPGQDYFSYQTEQWVAITKKATDAMASTTPAVSSLGTASASASSSVTALGTATAAQVTQSQALQDANTALGSSFADIESALQAVEALIGTTSDSGSLQKALWDLASELNGSMLPVQEIAYNATAASTGLNSLNVSSGSTAGSVGALGTSASGAASALSSTSGSLQDAFKALGSTITSSSADQAAAQAKYDAAVKSLQDTLGQIDPALQQSASGMQDALDQTAAAFQTFATALGQTSTYMATGNVTDLVNSAGQTNLANPNGLTTAQIQKAWSDYNSASVKIAQGLTTVTDGTAQAAQTQQSTFTAYQAAANTLNSTLGYMAAAAQGMTAQIGGLQSSAVSSVQAPPAQYDASTGLYTAYSAIGNKVFSATGTSLQAAETAVGQVAANDGQFNLGQKGTGGAAGPTPGGVNSDGIPYGPTGNTGTNYAAYAPTAPYRPGGDFPSSYGTPPSPAAPPVPPSGQGNPVVQVTVTGNNVLSSGMVNDLANKVATQVTTVLRRNANSKL